MTIPTALAPTAKLATPRVKKFVKGLLELFGPSAQLANFFLCEPGTNQVFGRKESWVEANWGADIIADRFSTADLETMCQKSRVIRVGDAVVYPHPRDSKIQIRLWLFARVMRY